MASGPTPTIGGSTSRAAERAPCYAIDLLGFGRSDQPLARLRDEPDQGDAVHYSFDLWGQQVADFCREIIQRPVLLVGNSIGGVGFEGSAAARNGTANQSLPKRGPD